jgi:PAS domain S-box-containing protein
MGVTSEAVLFVIVACIIVYFIERIRSGEARYRTVFEHSQIGIVLFNRADFTITQANDKFSDMLHYSPEETKTITFSDIFLNPHEKSRFLERIEKNVATENFVTQIRTHEGDGCWVNLSWSAIDEKTISCTAVNINARKLAEKLNSDNMMKYRQLTENSPTGILIIQNEVIRFANPSFAAFSGYTAAEVSCRELCSFIDPRDADTFLEFTRPWTGIAPKSGQREFRFVTKDSGIRVAIIFANPIMHFSKPAMMINLVDISEKLRLEEKIQRDNERRRGIITTVAHELRTPLQPILGYLNLLVQDPEGFGIVDDTKKILERCLVSVERERQIINQMLELSVLESGKLQLSKSNFSLLSLVNSVLDACGYSQKAEVTIDIPDSLMITADMDRLYSVLDSLLSNAINYTKPPRKIKIIYHSGINDTRHNISVQDNGIGIEESAFTSIFEPFQLADAAKLSRKYDRIGLSLSIAKKIIQMHGGDITVESRVNSGSTFSIHLPKEVPS